MLCTLAKVYDVHFWGAGSGDQRREFKNRASLQFYMRRRYGAGQWRQTGAILEVLQPYSRSWAAVGYIYALTVPQWCD